jgi:hypothetical protein
VLEFPGVVNARVRRFVEDVAARNEAERLPAQAAG